MGALIASAFRAQEPGPGETMHGRRMLKKQDEMRPGLGGGTAVY